MSYVIHIILVVILTFLTYKRHHSLILSTVLPSSFKKGSYDAIKIIISSVLKFIAYFLGFELKNTTYLHAT